MRKLTFMLITMLFPLCICAQDIWTEGTEWEVSYNDGTTHCFTLTGTETIDGTTYLKLIDTYSDETVGYIRSERGDTVVFARGIIDGEVTDEFVLYDFGTFEPETTFSYGCYNYETQKIIIINTTIKTSDITFFHDVITEGDLIPCCHDVLFKLGYIGGPMDLFYKGISEEVTDSEGPAGPVPRTRNVSHIVFRPKGRKGIMIVPTDIQPPSIAVKPSLPPVNLQGIPISTPFSGIIIINGKKYIFP